MAINLQSLIDSVLEMARNSQGGQLSKDDQQYQEFKKREYLSNEARYADFRKNDAAEKLADKEIASRKYEIDALGGASSHPTRRSLSGSSSGSPSDSGQSGKSFDEFIKAKLTANPMATAEDLRKDWGTLTAAAPTPGDVAARAYSGMSNPDFRKTVNDSNSITPTGGFGFVEQVGGKGFTRVLGSNVSSGPEDATVPQANIGSLKTGTTMERKNLMPDKFSATSSVTTAASTSEPFSLADRQKKFINENRSAGGYVPSFVNSPVEAEENKQYWRTENLKPKKTKEEIAKEQELNRKKYNFNY
jgi:hypothetical protein